jgi:photosystem II stability/assembly factor-like uncharacterized protein
MLAATGGAQAGQDRLYPLTANGPGQGGHVRAILTFGSDPNLLFTAILGDGVYKSIDGGATWSRSNSGITHPEVRTVRAKPGSTDVLYVATEGGAGFYKSTDGGASWQPANAGLTNRFAQNAIVIGGTGHLYIATRGGAYVSTDEGASWSRTCAADLSTTVITINADNTGQFIRFMTPEGIYFSNDFGATCFLRGLAHGMSGPGGTPPVVFDVRFTSIGGNSAMVAGVRGNGLFVSTDGGGTWSPATGIPAGAPPLSSFGQIGSNNLWAAFDGLGIYKTTDGGATWSLETGLNGLPRHMRFFFPGPGGTWWATTYAGVYKSVDSGANWTKSSAGLPNGHVVNITGTTTSLSDAELRTKYLIAETVYKSTDGGDTWSVADNGLNGRSTFRTNGIAVVGGDVSTLVVSTLNHGLYKTTDGGANWFPINNGLPANLVNTAVAFSIAASDTQVMYASFREGSGIFKTENGGAAWSDMSAGLPLGTAREVIRSAIHPTDPMTVYLATNDGVYKTQDGGTTWAQLSLGNFGGFGVNRVEISRWDPQTLLALSSWTDDLDRALTIAGVYLSRNGGETWRQLVSNERTTNARFVETPAGTRTDAYIITRGSFEEFQFGLFKCPDITNGDFTGNDCIEVPQGAGQGIPWSFGSHPGTGEPIRGLSTSTGMYRHRFLFLGPDFNNDGRSDIFWRNGTSGENWVWLMNGRSFAGFDEQGFEGVGQLRSVNSPWFIAGFGDFDGNGKTDILWRNGSTGENYIYLMDGFTIVGEGYIRTVPDQNWQVAGIGDFGSSNPLDTSDNDGRSDILWRHAVSGENYVYMMNGLEVASTEGFVRTVADPNWQVAAVGDLDGDTLADILWRNASTGENYLYPMQGRTVKPSEGYLRTVPGPWAIAGLGDFNQDDRMDVVWRNPSSGENYVYPMDGTTILPTEGYLPTVPDTGWAMAGLGDYDGHGDQFSVKGVSDILWRHASGSNYLWRMADPTTVTTMCGDLGCTDGYLPTINAAGFDVVNK